MVEGSLTEEISGLSKFQFWGEGHRTQMPIGCSLLYFSSPQTITPELVQPWWPRLDS
jgi:hypothetical protein